MRKIRRNKTKEAGSEEEVESEEKMPQGEAVEDMTEEDLIAEQKIVICKVVKTDENMVISPKVRRVSTLEDKRMLKAGNREGPCPTLGRGPSPSLGRGPSPTAPAISVSSVPIPPSLSASLLTCTRSAREVTKLKSSNHSYVSLRFPSSPPALFPLAAAANPLFTPGANYNTNEAPRSLPPRSPVPIPPLSLAAPSTPAGEVFALLDSHLVFGLDIMGSNSGSSGGIPSHSIPAISSTVSAPEVQTTMPQAASVLIRPVLLSSHHP